MTYSLETIIFQSGDLFLPNSIRKFLELYWIGNDNSLFYVNNWTIVHFISGCLTFYCFQYFSIKQNTTLYAFGIHTIWELWQILGKNTKYWTRRGRLDIVTDTIFYMLGFLMIKSFSGTK